jgi:hypothetical protein
MAITLMPVEEHSYPKDIRTPLQPIRSLIPPLIPIRLKNKTSPNTIRRRRSSSTKSITSSLLSRQRRSAIVPTPTLATMPAELLSYIFAHLNQRELHVLMLTNSNFIEIAATYLYSSPVFASTYRFAQFVSTVSHKSHYAFMVRCLDLSCFSKLCIDEEGGELRPLAGWREFKYRHHHGARKGHPAPSPFLQSYHRTRDIPIGALNHVFAACARLQKLNLSRLQLAADFLVASPATSKGLLFVSDVPKSWTWTSSELVAVGADEVVRWVCGLGELGALKARGCVWLTTVRVGRLMENAGEALLKVDFRESGMQKDARWAVRGSRGEVERIVKEVLENTRESAS